MPSKKLLKEDLQFRVENEINNLLKEKNPIIYEDIDSIWIFSGPGTYLSSLKKGEERWQKWMDKDRILHGIYLAKKVTAKRLHKSFKKISKADLKNYAPYLIYNGTPKENKAIYKSLNDKTFPLPKEKVIIIDHTHDKKGRIHEIKNTLDQITSFEEEQLGANKNFRRLAIVSHVEHFPRILRYIEKFRPFSIDKKIEIYPLKPSKKVDKYYTQEEIKKVWKYYKKGDLSKKPFKRGIIE